MAALHQAKGHFRRETVLVSIEYFRDKRCPYHQRGGGICQPFKFVKTTAYGDKLKLEPFDLGDKFFSSDIHWHLRTPSAWAVPSDAMPALKFSRAMATVCSFVKSYGTSRGFNKDATDFN